jgi:hypothetical protein
MLETIGKISQLWRKSPDASHTLDTSKDKSRPRILESCRSTEVTTLLPHDGSASTSCHSKAISPTRGIYTTRKDCNRGRPVGTAGIAKARKKQGLTQADVATFLGVSQPTYSNWERLLASNIFESWSGHKDVAVTRSLLKAKA